MNYPVKDNSYYISLVDGELKPIRCINDITSILREEKLNELGI
jgi:hypothetical protein